MLNPDSSRFVLLVVCWCGGALPGDARPTYGQPPDAPITCAVIADRSEAAGAVAELVGVQLGGVAGVRVVERGQIQAVLNEQTLSAAFASEDLQSRVALGKLVKADLLVLIRERAAKALPDEQEKKAPAKKAIELVVAETRRGLRLVRSTAASDPKMAEQTADAWVALIARARELAGHDDLKVFGVPAFECKDVMGEYASLRRGMAVLVEECLMTSPGVVAVELTEAQALAREAAIGGEAVARDLPHYLIGSYKTSRDRQRVIMDVSIELKRGEVSLATAGRQGIDGDHLDEVLQDLLNELLPKAGGLLRLRARASEITTLLERADMFRSLVEWDEALPLYESVLLLDRDNTPAHLQLFEGYLVLAYASIPVGSPAYDPALRMEHGETALMHASALLRKGEFTREMLERLGQLTVMFHQADSSRQYREGRWRCAVDALAADVLSCLKDPKRLARLDEALRARAIHEMAAVLEWDNTLARLDEALRARAIHEMAAVLEWDNTLAPPSEGVARKEALLLLLDELKLPMRKFFWIAVHRLPAEQLAEVFDRLEKHPSPQLQTICELGRMFLAASEEATRPEAISQAKAYIRAQKLPSSLVETFESESQERLNAAIRLKNRTNTTQPSDDSVFLPRLAKLSERWRLVYPSGEKSRGSPYVRDWLACGPGTDILLLSQGVFRLSGEDTLQNISPLMPGSPWHFMRHQAAWDGRFLWIAIDKPRPMIAVLDPRRGEVARFDESDVVEGSQVSEGELIALRAGQVFFFGSLRKSPEPVRNWAMLLEVTPQSGGTMRKRFERIYEARETTTPNTKEQIGSAAPLYWAVLVPSAGASGGPCVLAKTWKGGAIVFDIAAKTARAAKTYWPSDCPVYLDERLLVPYGSVSSLKQNSELRWSDHPDHPLKSLIDWGERPINSYLGAHMFFTSAVMYRGQLHLLARGDAPCSPAWIAVDPKTWQTRILVDRFPQKWGDRYMERLCVSARNELIFISGGRAFKADLPPVSTWPVMKAQIHAPKVLAAATKPG